MLYLIAIPVQVNAAEIVEFSGKFKNKVILVINGKTRTVKVGDTSPEGITVEKLNNDIITLNIKGVIKQFKLGETSSFRTQYAQQATKEVIISLNGNGQFLTAGAINKQVVSFLVDTGANTVALNSGHARKLGIDYTNKGSPTMVSTASGVTKAWKVNLDIVSVGEITLHHVEAVIIEGNFPTHILLGMSFLGNLEIYREQQTMTLKKKW